MPHYSIQGRSLFVQSQGAGPPLLLVHGFPLDHTMWVPQFVEFSQTHRVISPDLRGLGNSEVTPGTVTMQDFADDLAGILEAMQIAEPVVLCGLSMGGYITLRFFAKHRARLKALILCDTKAAADSEEAKQTRYKTADLVSRSGTEFLAESMPAKLFAKAAIGTDVDRTTRDVIRRANPIGVAAAQLGMAARPDSTALLSQIDVPTLIIVGTEDVITPPTEMRGMAEAIPGAEYVEIPNVGHMAPLEAPHVVNPAIRKFLNRL